VARVAVSGRPDIGDAFPQSILAIGRSRTWWFAFVARADCPGYDVINSMGSEGGEIRVRFHFPRGLSV